MWSKDFALLWLASLASATGFAFLLPTLPLYVKSLGGQDAEVGFVVGIFGIAALVARVFAGRALDLQGRKRPLMAGASLVLVAMLLLTVTASVHLTLLVRFLHGAGFGVASTAGLAKAADLAPPKRRGEALGYYSNAQMMATGAGPAIAFWLLALPGLPLRGFPLLFVACGAVTLLQLLLVLFVDEPHRLSVDQAAVAAGHGTSGFFSRTAVPTAVAMFFVSFALGGVFTFMPIYLSAENTQYISVFFLVNTIVATVSLPLAGTLADRFGRQVVTIPLMVLASVGAVSLAFSPSLPVVLVSAILSGVGFGALSPTLLAFVMDSAKPQERGAATATFLAGTDIGIATGSMILGLVVQAAGFSAMFLVAGGVITLGLVYFLTFHRLFVRWQVNLELALAGESLPTERVRDTVGQER